MSMSEERIKSVGNTTYRVFVPEDLETSPNRDGFTIKPPGKMWVARDVVQ